MKKLMIFCVVFCALAIGGAMTLKSVQNQRWADPLLIENAEAFAAECFYCGRTLPCYCGMGGGSGEDDQEGGEPGNGGGGSYFGTCAAISTFGSICYVSKAVALAFLNYYTGGVGNWCCDSCSSSTWWKLACG